MAEIIVASIQIALLVVIFAALALAAARIISRFLESRGSWMNEKGLAALVALAIALLLNPAVGGYLLRIVAWLGRSITAVVGDIEAWASIADECGTNCAQLLMKSAGTGLGEFITNQIRDLSSIWFPLDSVLLFLVAFLLVMQVIRYCVTRIRESSSNPDRARPVINLAFLTIVATAFYLSLTSLLAIPLMQSQVVDQGFSSDDLEKALAESNIGDAELAQRFPELAPIAPPQSETAEQDTRQVVDAVGSLVASYRTAREAALDQIRGLAASAANAYKSKNAQHLEGKETIGHFAALLGWHQRQKRELDRQFNACRTSTREVLSAAQTFIADVQRNHPTPSPVDRTMVEIDSFEIVQRAFNAQSDCNSWQNSYISDPPERPNRGSDLGIVGSWTQWLLSTESVPLVNIIGLIGFSLLGATLSRIVRSGTYRGDENLSLADILKVLAGGVAAAMFVFLASYGGLAVLGETTGDPNPYVIFALCLVGAIFSENIWEWARNWLEGTFPGDDEEGAKGKKVAPGADAVVD